MKKIVTLVILISFTHGLHAVDNYCNEYRKVLEIYEAHGINSIDTAEFDHDLFIDMFKQFLDPHALYFSSETEAEISKVGEKIKTVIKNGYCLDRNFLINTFRNSLKNTLDQLDNIRNETLNFDEDDSLYIEKAKKNEDLATKWKRYLKYSILSDLSPDKNYFDSIRSEKKLYYEKTEVVKLSLIEFEKEKIVRLLNNEPLLEEKVFTAYINSFLLQFDPHSLYFSNEMLLGFQEGLSSTSSSFGFMLEKNAEGEYIISSIVPGSYAWKTGEINVGDKVLRLKTNNRNALTLAYSTFREVNEYILNTDQESLLITVTNKLNQKKEITLYKAAIDNTENSVQAVVLNGKTRVGYISLPAFYTSWESDITGGCANDVGRALYELKKQNIQSLILDLRDNAGGSVKEAIELAGIFVDFGTFTVQEDKNNTLVSIKDMSRGMMYTGPLAIMINHESASASEMVAAVLQDYNRAVIVGSNSFGKASGQAMIPIVDNLNEIKYMDKPDFNMLKLSTYRYYRVSGQSYQIKGIIPHISLPQLRSMSKGSESDYKRALKNRSINKKTYYKPLAALPVDSLEKHSEIRVSKHEKFKSITLADSMIKEFLNRYTSLPLNISGYSEFLKEKEKILSFIESTATSPTDVFTIENLESRQKFSEIFKYYSTLQEQLNKAIITDPYIEETYNIVNDLLILKKKQ